MRVPLLIGLCVVMAASAAFAGGTPNTAMGARQMVFMFEGLSFLDLQPYAGGFGFRYFYADDTAIRGGVNFAYDKCDYGDDYDETYTRFGATVAWEKYMAPIASVAPYMGIGVSYIYHKWDPAPVETTTFAEDTDEKTQSDLGIGLLAGFQWYFTEAISLGGEYRLGFTYSTGTVTQGDVDSDTTCTQFGFNTASVFFSVHF